MSDIVRPVRIYALDAAEIKAVDQKAHSFRSYLENGNGFPTRFFDLNPQQPASLELHSHFLAKLGLPEIVEPPLHIGEELIENVAEESGRAITRQLVFLDRNENYRAVEGAITAYYFGQPIKA